MHKALALNYHFSAHDVGFAKDVLTLKKAGWP